MASSSDSQNVSSDHEKRRQLRQDYRTLIAETQKNRQELICPESDGLQTTLDRADTLFTQVVESKCPREAALDSHLMVLVSSLGKERAQKLHTDFHTFEPSEFADKLVMFMSDGRIQSRASEQATKSFRKEGWAKLGREANSCFRRAPAFHFMLGSFERGEAPAKVRKQSATRQKEKDSGPAVVPKQIQSMGKSDQEVTTEEVERMLGILHQVTNFDPEDLSEGEPVSLFEFVVNPHSFSQTVENIFHLSFLVKDGHVQVELDDDRLPVIIPTTPYVEGQSSKQVDRKQVMMSLSMSQWEEIVRVFEIKEPLIPTRMVPSRDLNGVNQDMQEMEISNGEPHRKKKAHGSSRSAQPSNR